MTAILILIFRIVLLIILLSFFGWAIYTLWLDLRFQTQSLVTRKIPFISILRENESVDNRQVFLQSELRIGRDPASEILVNHETVSNQHARLWYRNKQWWIEDLLSTNGTFLNDERIETPTILISGDEIRVGKVLLEIEIQQQS
ncbi:MAG: FHA domain-containing protein [Anaerolineaceae bacterium]|jgi:pSer/pThr/pTyr-binding forkhead associated (FHA) protein